MIRFCGADGLLPSFFSGRLSVTGIADRASFVRVRICDRTIRSPFIFAIIFLICCQKSLWNRTCQSFNRIVRLMKRCMIYAVIVLFLLPLCGMAKKRTSKEERTNNHSAFLYYREFGPSVIKGFVYLFFDTLNRSFVLMESNHLGSSFAEYGACRINGDTLVLTPFVYSSTFLYLTDYIRENTNLDDEQIEKELDLLGENNSSDTVRSLYNEWCSLRFKPIDVPVFRSKKESINLCLDPDKFSEYRYIMKGRKLINITAKEIKYRQHNILLQDLYKVDLPIPPEKEAFRKIILYSYKD